MMYLMNFCCEVKLDVCLSTVWLRSALQLVVNKRVLVSAWWRVGGAYVVMEGERPLRSGVCNSVSSCDRVSTGFCCGGTQVSDRQQVQTPSGED